MTADRYSLAKVGGESLLLDLVTGEVFGLNSSATLIWEQRLSGASRDDIVARLTDVYGVERQLADRDVTDSLTLASQRTALPTEFNYERTPNGYSFSRGETVLLNIADRDHHLEVARTTETSTEDLPNLLQAIVPKLVALRGYHVLHASGVVANGVAIAFSGESGAGKTTTARSFARAGAELICEDKLVVVERHGQFEALPDGEPALREWVGSAAVELTSRPRTILGDLTRLRGSKAVRLSQIGFLERARRLGAGIEASPLAPLSAAGAIFRNSFYGRDAAEEWAARLRWAASAAAAVQAFDLTVPDGVDRLDVATASAVALGSLRSP